MRDIQELMKTQVMSPVNNKSSISHALQLHEELDKLRRKNEQLKAQNSKLSDENQSLKDGQRTYVDLISELEHDLKTADDKHQKQQTTLRQQLDRLQVSWDSLYDDLSKVRDERNELRAKLDEVREINGERGDGSGDGVEGIDSDKNSNNDDVNAEAPPKPSFPLRRSASLRSSVFQLTRPGSLTPSSPSSDGNNNRRPIDQAELLRKAVRKHSSFSAAAGHHFGVSKSNTTETSGSSCSNIIADRKIHELECENLKLKSTIVRLQTQYKEEKYRNSHPNSTTNSILPPPSKHPSPIPEQQPSAPSMLSRRSVSLQPRSRMNDCRVYPQPASSSSTSSSSAMNPALALTRHVEFVIDHKTTNPTTSAAHPSHRRTIIEEDCAEEDDEPLKHPVGRRTGTGGAIKKHTEDRDSTSATTSSFSDDSSDEDSSENSDDEDNISGQETYHGHGRRRVNVHPKPSKPTSTPDRSTSTTSDRYRSIIDRSSTGGASTTGHGIFGGLRRSRSLYPGSSTGSSSSSSSSSSAWGRSPARDQYLQRENQSILSSHPAYHSQPPSQQQQKNMNYNGNNSSSSLTVETEEEELQSSFSTLGDIYQQRQQQQPSLPAEPKRARSLVRWW